MRTSWKHALKDAAKETLWRFNRHTPGPRPDIFLFSSRRSGSTWLMEVIAANRGVKYIDQPFCLYSASSAQLRQLPVVDRSKLVSLDDEDYDLLRAYVDGLHEGRLSFNAPWELWKSVFDFRSDRLVLKIIDGKALIDWFDQTFKPAVVYSIRHPIPMSLSVMRNDWEVSARAFLRSPSFVEAHLDAEQEALCRDVLHHGSQLLRYVLNWALENLVPLRLLPERPHWHLVTYEETILRPEATVDRLANVLDLTDRDRMLRQVRRRSRSTKKAVSTIDETNSAEARLRLWKQHVSDDEERAAFDLLERLGITMYRYGDPMPTYRGA